MIARARRGGGGGSWSGRGLGLSLGLLVACGAPGGPSEAGPREPSPAEGASAGPATADGLARAREARARRTPEALRQARDLYERAARADPGDAEAAAGEAICGALLALYGAEPAASALPAAREAADRGLALDPDHGEALAARGLVAFLYERDDAAADRAFRRASEVAPELGEVQHWWAMVARAQLDASTALERVRRARELAPGSRILAVKWGTVLAEAGREEEALSHLDEVLEGDPDFAVAHRSRGVVLLRLGRFAPAQAAFEQAWSCAPGQAASAAGACYAAARSGDPAAARRWAGEVGPEAPLQRAIVHASLEEWDTAFDELERAHQHQDPGLVYLAVQPWFEGLRQDPRGADWLRRLRLPAPAESED